MTKRYDIGLGALMETIGLASTNKLLAFLKSQPTFENVVPLIVSGTLNIRSPLVAQMLPVLVSYGQLTASESAALLALGQETEPQTATITISLPTGHACQHDASLLVVAGGTFAAGELVEVAAPGGAAVAFPAQFILTGQN